MADDLSDLRRPVDAVEIARRAAQRIQRRNLESLANAQGPGGPPLAPNKPRTVKNKGHDRVGFYTGEMAHGLVAPTGANIVERGNEVEVKVFGGPGNTDAKVNIFVRGQRNRVGWQSARTASGKRKAWKTNLPPVPGRDFFGLAEQDVDAIAEDATDSILKAWGFR